MTEAKQTQYTDTQRNIATAFYILFIVAVIVTITGIIWVIVDWLLGETKITEWLFSQNLGIIIMIFGALFAGLFFIIVFSYGFFKRGRKRILKWTFKAKDVDEKYKNRTEIKVIAFAFLFSIIAIIVGVIIFVVMLLLTVFTAVDPSQTLAAFSTSQLCLFIGIALMILDGLGIFVINFMKNGYYFVLKLIGGLEKEN
ncbi:MAG: hypothetical protein ACFFBP_11190 [Promethearchaeota archaeon]